MGCSPETSTEKFVELFELTGEMPSFKEIAEKCANVGVEARRVYGQGLGHIDETPLKISLFKQRQNDPNEPTRYAICHCGCPDCRPQDWNIPMPPPREKTFWEKRADDLSKSPGGRKGFMQLLRELERTGSPIAIKISGQLVPNLLNQQGETNDSRG